MSQTNHQNNFEPKPHYAVTTGTSTAYVVSIPGLPLQTGTPISIKAHVASGINATINVNGAGAKAIKKDDGTGTVAGDLKLNGVYTLVYDGTDFYAQEKLTSQIISTGSLRVSAVQTTLTPSPTLTHNLNVTSGDVITGRYSVYYTRKNSAGFGTGVTMTSSRMDGSSVDTRSGSDIGSGVNAWQANTIIVHPEIPLNAPDGSANCRVIIKQNR